MGAVLFLVLGLAPLQDLWEALLLEGRAQAPARLVTQSVFWIRSQGDSDLTPEDLRRLEAFRPKAIFLAEPTVPPARTASSWYQEAPPPGGGRAVRSLADFRGSSLDFFLRSRGATAASLPSRVLLDPARMPADFDVRHLEDPSLRKLLEGSFLVVGPHRSFNAPPTARGPLPLGQTYAWGLSTALEGHGLTRISWWQRALSTLGVLGLCLAVFFPLSGVPRLKGAAFLSLVSLAAGFGLGQLGVLAEPISMACAGWLAAAILKLPRTIDPDQEVRDLLELYRGEGRTPGFEIRLQGLDPRSRALREKFYDLLESAKVEDHEALPEPVLDPDFRELLAPELSQFLLALEALEVPARARLDWAEWAWLKDPENPAIEEAWEECREELATEFALMDLETVFSSIEDRYVDKELLGQGTMGLVLKARDAYLDRPVALKIVNPIVLGDADTQGRFFREIEALGDLSHPHIVSVYGVQANAEIPYYAMEFLDGEPLSRELSEGKLTLAQKLRILEQLAGALDLLHARGFIHRDLKTENMVLTRSEAELRLVLIDFGIAKGLGSRPLTQKGDILGTVSTMPPEQIRGQEVDARADRFAYGVIAWETLTGARPYPSPYQVEDSLPPDLRECMPDAPESLAKALQELLHPDRDQRPESLEPFRRELELWSAP